MRCMCGRNIDGLWRGALAGAELRVDRWVYMISLCSPSFIEGYNNNNRLSPAHTCIDTSCRNAKQIHQEPIMLYHSPVFPGQTQEIVLLYCATPDHRPPSHQTVLYHFPAATVQRAIFYDTRKETRKSTTFRMQKLRPLLLRYTYPTRQIRHNSTTYEPLAPNLNPPK